MKLKNSLLLIASLIFNFSVFAQSPATFENLTLSVESYWDGSDLTGQHNNGLFNSTFSSGDFTFSNTYDTTFGSIYGYWSKGWAYSNITDSITSGAANLFSARAGKGAFESENYVVGTNNSTIIFNQPQGFTAMVTNSTYAANSMRDGDMFAKKFTNADQDYFKLTVFGYYSGNIIDSATFLLADFTHADSTDDYIVNEWKYIGMPNNLLDSVQFKLASSDVGQFGMNTPAYFCLDNVGPLPLNTPQLSSNDFLVYPNPASEVVYFTNNSSSSNFILTVFDASGRMIIENQQNPLSLELSMLPKGLYFLRFSNDQGQMVKKITKN